jgi:hypothetical protein
MGGDAQPRIYCEPGTGMEYGQRDRVQVYSTGQANPKCSDSRSGAERFNKSYREGVLDANLFETINQVREVSQEWVWDFNNHRPHDALKGMSPVMYRKQQERLFGLRSAPASPPLHEDQIAVNLTLN